jgi:hypothetical protein
MNATDVERLVRDVIANRGLPFKLSAVSGSPSEWHVAVQTDTGDIIRFPLFDGRPVSMRIAIQNALGAADED